MRRGWNERGKPSRPNVWILLLAVVLLYGITMGAIYVFGNRWERKHTSEEAVGNLDERFVPTLTMERGGQRYSYYENYFTNILVIGVDQASFSQSSEQRSGGQADFLMLLSLSRPDKMIRPIHIDRDSMAEIPIVGAFGNPAGTREMQVCLSHVFGETQQECSENTVGVISDMLGGIRIDYYITMDMDGIAALNDALGGVTVTLEEDFSQMDPAMTKDATIRLQGKQAEYYVRGRYGVGDYTNAQRMKHQRQFIDSAVPMMYEQMEEDVEFLGRMFDELLPHMCTNITKTWLLNQSYAIQNYALADTIAIEGEHRIGSDGFMEFHPDRNRLDDMLIELFYQ